MGKDTVLDLDLHLFVRWADIDTEVRPFRDGFVDAYLKHEGAAILDDEMKPTGEKVTQATFCKYFGIAPATFDGWLKARNETRTYAPRKPRKKRDSDTESSDIDAWINREPSNAQARVKNQLVRLDERSAGVDDVTKAERRLRLLETAGFELRQSVERRWFERVTLPEKLAELRAAVKNGEPLPEPDVSTLAEVIAEAAKAA